MGIFQGCGVAGILWRDNRESELQHSRLPLSQVKLLFMQAKPGLNAHTYVVNGRIRNQSKEFTIIMIELQVNLQDCVSEHCDLVSQADHRIFLEVPPAQARELKPLSPFSSVIGSPQTFVHQARNAHSDLSFEI